MNFKKNCRWSGSTSRIKSTYASHIKDDHHINNEN